MDKPNYADLRNAVAIIGMTGRFPGAATLREFWSNLRDGKESISFFTEEELLAAGLSAARVADPNFVRARGVYRNPLAFDARFFGFTPRDAELMDPQQRIFLECCWEALEIAGHDPGRFPGRIGVFAGSGVTHYLFEIMARSYFRTASPFTIMTSNDKDYVATRVGYKLGLRGPCITVQTACSTSLVATVLGCQSLLTYQSDLILAGGSTVVPSEVGGYDYQEGGIVSPDGHCRSFDAAAKGTIFSSGVGVVVLKRFEDALADRDHVYAVIRGCGLNNDGSMRAGFTAPGVEGQTAVTTEALATSGIDPETISYIECHGTATALGDPIEIKALSQAFGAFTAKKGFCAVGSVKANIGHTDSAAGVAGLIKTVLALNHRFLPATIHYQSPNPDIHFEETPFYVNATGREWTSDGPRRAGVNSFGIGGTNAHVIVEEAPPLPPTSASRPWQLLVWSARTPAALDALTERLKQHIEDTPDTPLADLAFTLQVGRRTFDHRRCLVCADREGALRAIAAPDALGPLTFQLSGPAPKIVFLFPGQGSQHVQMARQLYRSETTFRDAFDACADLFRAQLDDNLRGLVYPAAGAAAGSAERLQQTRLTQPALFAVEYALAKQWEAWGVTPAAMLGHSIGEYVAACLAGVMSLADATSLVAARATLMQGVPDGSMLSVLLPEHDVLSLLKTEPRVSLAAANGPTACVVSGPHDAIEALARRLAATGVPNRRLKTSHAFHSAMMDPILPAFAQHVRRVTLSAPQRPYLSNLTGTWIRAEEATDPDYWVRHLRQPVKFSAAIEELVRSLQHVAFLEAGPGKALTTLVSQQIERGGSAQAIASLPPADQDGADDLASMLRALGHLWGAGVDVAWDRFYAGEERRRVPAMTYPFERDKYGLEQVPAAAAAPSPARSTARRPFEDWFRTINWLRTPAPAPAATEQEQFVVIAESRPLGSRISGALTERGMRVVTVVPGAVWSEDANGDFTIRPDDEDDYQALLAALVESGRTPRHIVHALGAAVEHTEDGVDHAEQVLERCFYGPMHLVKAINTRLKAQPVTLDFLSATAFDVVGRERMCPASATLYGPTIAAAKEVKGVATRLLDLEISGDWVIDADDLRLLVEELCQPTTANQHIVAFRGGHRWVRNYDRISLPAVESGRALRPHGVYLITGGFGGIGLSAARYLAQHVQPKLVLIGRSAIPSRDTWTDYLEHTPAADATAERIREILALEALGAEVLACQADVANEPEMRRAIAQARERFGPINGVIHAAGIGGEGITEFKQKQVADAVLRPKVHGSLILDKLLRDDDLDFFVLCGSLTGVLGGAGQIDYTAANAFLDAFAWSKRRAAKNRPISIDWDRWEDVGMAARHIRELNARKARLVDGKEEALAHPVFTRRITGRDHDTYAFHLSAKTHWVAGEHKIAGRPTMVGTSHLEYVRAAYSCCEGTDLVEIRDLMFIQPVMLRDGEERDVFYTLKAARNGQREFTVWSVDGGKRQDHARGRVGAVPDAQAQTYDAQAILARCGNARKPVMSEGVSTNGDAAPVQLSARWAIFERIADSDTEAIAEIRLSPTHIDDLSTYLMHPAVLDCATSYASGPSFRSMYLPIAYQRLRIFKTLAPVMYSYKQFKGAEGGTPEVFSCDVVVFDQSGDPVIDIQGFTLKRVPDIGALASRGAAQTAASEADRLGSERFGRRITPEEGVEVLKRVIATPWAPQLLVHAGESELLGTDDQSGEDEADEGKSEKGPSQTYARPPLGTPYVAPRTDLEGAIADIWQGILGIDKIGVHDDFIELGGHSLLALQLTSRVSETFGIDFSVSDFYQEPTVDGLARSILVKLAEGLEDGSLEELLAAEASSDASVSVAGA